MFPKISDLVNFVLGSHVSLPFQTYGFMLMLGFLTGSLVLRSELRRKEREGRLAARVVKPGNAGVARGKNLLLQCIVAAFMAWKFVGLLFDYPQFADNPQKYLFSLQGNLVAPAVVVAGYLRLFFIRWKNRTVQNREVSVEIIHPYQHTWSIMIVALMAALVGSKLFDTFDHFEAFLRNPMHSLLSFNGFAFYGGLLVTIFALILYMRVVRLDWKEVIDCSAPAILAGYAVGRLGCHLSGDGCWGIVNMAPLPDVFSWLPVWLWACNYPHNVINAGTAIPGCTGMHCMVLPQPVYPTSLYESLLATLSFCILWMLRRRIKAPVVLFGLFLILFGTDRLLIEQIRINVRFGILGLQPSQAELISSGLILAGIPIMIFYRKRYQKYGYRGFHDDDTPSVTL